VYGVVCSGEAQVFVYRVVRTGEADRARMRLSGVWDLECLTDSGTPTALPPVQCLVSLCLASLPFVSLSFGSLPFGSLLSPPMYTCVRVCVSVYAYKCLQECV